VRRAGRRRQFLTEYSKTARYQKERLAAVVNLEGRSGRWGDLPNLIGRDLLTASEVVLDANSPIPLDPLILENAIVSRT
jgi:hypothetical protein